MPEHALDLARMHAGGIISRPAEPARIAALRAAAARAGRRLVEIDDPNAPALSLGWPEGAEPVAGDDSGVERAPAAPTLALTLAAALRACWAESADHPWPGTATTETTVLAALANFANRPGEDLTAAERHRKGALRRLRDAGYLTGEGSTVRLGPAVAAWSESQVAPLRAAYNDLPRPPAQENDG